MSTWNYQYASKAKQVRRTFFSFHYQYDVTRAHVVRNSWVTKEDREDAGFFDASVFESKKRAGDETLKRFITEAFNGTTVTGVLIGNQTAMRPWVRYELVRSFQRGNGLFGVRIHNIKNLEGQCANAGGNPFEYLGYVVSGGQVTWREWDGHQWVDYTKVPSATIAETGQSLSNGESKQFSARFPIYDWVTDNGYQNLGAWIESAAKQAGK